MKKYVLLLLLLATRLIAGEVSAQCTIRYWNPFEVGRTALHAIRDTVPHVLDCVTIIEERPETGGEGEEDPYYQEIMKYVDHVQGVERIMEIRCGQNEAGEVRCYCLLKREEQSYTVLVLKRTGRNHWFETVTTLPEEEYTRFYMACEEEYRR